LGIHRAVIGELVHDKSRSRAPRIRLAHAAEDPRLRGLDMDQHTAADLDVRQAVRLLSPAAHGPRTTVHFFCEGLDVNISVEKIRFGGGHCGFAFLKRDRQGSYSTIRAGRTTFGLGKSVNYLDDSLWRAA